MFKRVAALVILMVFAGGILGFAEGDVGEASAAYPPPELGVGLEQYKDDAFFYDCSDLGCWCVSSDYMCCVRQCCHWTCWFMPPGYAWMCSCFYISSCLWWPNCYNAAIQAVPARHGCRRRS